MKNMITNLIKLLSIFLFFISCQSAFSANDYVVERSFFDDKSGQLSFEQARDQKYKKFSKILFNGYGNTPVWIKVRIDPNLPNNSAKKNTKIDNQNLSENVSNDRSKNQTSTSRNQEKLIVKILPSYLDEIELFDPLELTSKPRRVGEHFPWQNNEHASFNYAFEIPRGDTPRDIWFRLKTTSTQLMKIEVLDKREFSNSEKIQELIFGGWLGLLAIILLWSFGIWIINRDKLVGNFVLNQFAVLIHASVIMGVFRIVLDGIIDPKTIDLLGNLVILTFAFTVIRFQYCFHLEFVLKTWVRWFFRGLLVCYPLGLLLLFSNHIAEAMKVNISSLLATSFLLILIPLFGIHWTQSTKSIISKSALITVDLLLLMVGLINILPALGLIELTSIAPFVGLSYGLVTGFVFLLLLQYRYREINNERIVEVSRALANASAEASKRIEQEKFLAMLTHELKTPLSVLLMAHGSKDGFEKYGNFVGEAISDMRNVLERCMLADQFDSQALMLKIEQCDLEQATTEKIKLYPAQERLVLQSTGPIHIQADTQLLSIILINLLDNAFKYSAEDQPITLRLSTEKKDHRALAILRITNAPGNAGLPDPERVFAKYYRAPRAHEKTGSGLGLYLIQNIAKAMGGELVFIPQHDLVVFELRVALSL